MNLIHSTMSHDIGYAFGSDPRLSQARSVATASLNATITFSTQLMASLILSTRSSTFILSSLRTRNKLPYQHLKLVKRGFRGAATLQVCGVSLEICPLWICSLLLSNWKTIYATDFDEVRLQQYYSTTWTFVKVIVLIISRQEIASMQGNADVGFASGSRAFQDTFEGRRECRLFCGWKGTSGEGLSTPNRELGSECHTKRSKALQLREGCSGERVWTHSKYLGTLSKEALVHTF
jgi:hypothetical protein